MSHKDSGWRPKGATQKYNGFEVWDHGIWPNEVHTGVVDGKISFDFLEDGAELEDDGEDGVDEGDESEDVEADAAEGDGEGQGEERATDVDDREALGGDGEAAATEEREVEEGGADATPEADASAETVSDPGADERGGTEAGTE